MECLESKETINSTVVAVSDVSYAEKKEALLTEDEINKFLDHLLELYSFLSKKTKGVNNVIATLDKLFHLENLDEECLKLMNILISVGRDFSATLDKQYQNFKYLADQGIAKAQIDEFKECIDYLQETIDDLESVFLVLPKKAGFLEATQQLCAL